MELTDFMDKDGWLALQDELHHRFALNADVMDKQGKRLAPNTWGNELCRAIREDKKGFGAICAPAGQMFLQLMQTNREPFAEECDAGMMRICVPALHKGEFLGAVGGCGLIPEDGELDEFTIDMMSDLDGDAIARMAGTVDTASDQRVAEIQGFISKRLDEILA